MDDDRKPKTDAHKYQNDFDRMMRRAEERAERARLWRAERFNMAVANAVAAGMNKEMALKIITDNETEASLLPGVEALEAETIRGQKLN